MADNTHIEWTDATWNIITGCSVVSAGCKHCYAMKLAGTRLRHDPSRAGLTRETSAGPIWTGEVRFNEQWLCQPLRWKRPRRIFVCAHGDLFHESVPDAWIDRVFAMMLTAHWHTFQVLTKRAERMRAYLADTDVRDRVVMQAGMLAGEASKRGDTGMAGMLWVHGKETINRDGGFWPLANVWLGVSVENQAAADERIPLLLECPAAVRWVSAEPLLGPVDLSAIDDRGDGTVLDALRSYKIIGPKPPGYERPRVHWVVAGGESGAGARPMHPDWARSLRDQCAAAGVSFLFKQWGSWAPHMPAAGDDLGGDLRRGVVQHLHGVGNPDGHFTRGDAYVRLVGKKAAGRLLDGVHHDGYPEVRA